jgi:uncharacterized protein YqgC (DUF456 family)
LPLSVGPALPVGTIFVPALGAVMVRRLYAFVTQYVHSGHVSQICELFALLAAHATHEHIAEFFIEVPQLWQCFFAFICKVQPVIPFVVFISFSFDKITVDQFLCDPGDLTFIYVHVTRYIFLVRAFIVRYRDEIRRVASRDPEFTHPFDEKLIRISVNDRPRGDDPAAVVTVHFIPPFVVFVCLSLDSGT